MGGGEMSLSREQIIEGTRMLNGGASWGEVVNALGSSYHAVQMALKPGYSEKRRARDRARYRGTTGAIYGRPRMTVAAAHKAVAAIPPDTRSVTGRLFGDPIHERSALAQRGAS